jgi:hypothetical protein
MGFPAQYPCQNRNIIVIKNGTEKTPFQSDYHFMVTQFTIETPRLLLRSLSLVDAPSIQPVASVREVADTMISIPYPYPDGEAEQYIRRQISEFEVGHSVRSLGINPDSLPDN